jgi:hypothetical protein
MKFYNGAPHNSASTGLTLWCKEPDWIPTIAVPARNEASRLPLLMRALSGQTWLNVKGRRLDVTIVLNNCDDNSMDVAQSEAALHSNLHVSLINVEFPENQAHVGSARRLAAESGCSNTGMIKVTRPPASGRSRSTSASQKSAPTRSIR